MPGLFVKFFPFLVNLLPPQTEAIRTLAQGFLDAQARKAGLAPSSFVVVDGKGYGPIRVDCLDRTHCTFGVSVDRPGSPSKDGFFRVNMDAEVVKNPAGPSQAAVVLRYTKARCLWTATRPVIGEDEDGEEEVVGHRTSTDEVRPSSIPAVCNAFDDMVLAPGEPVLGNLPEGMAGALGFMELPPNARFILDGEVLPWNVAPTAPDLGGPDLSPAPDLRPTPLPLPDLGRAPDLRHAPPPASEDGGVPQVYQIRQIRAPGGCTWGQVVGGGAASAVLLLGMATLLLLARRSRPRDGKEASPLPPAEEPDSIVDLLEVWITELGPEIAAQAPTPTVVDQRRLNLGLWGIGDTEAERIRTKMHLLIEWLRYDVDGDRSKTKTPWKREIATALIAFDRRLIGLGDDPNKGALLSVNEGRRDHHGLRKVGDPDRDPSVETLPIYIGVKMDSGLFQGQFLPAWEGQRTLQRELDEIFTVNPELPARLRNSRPLPSDARTPLLERIEELKRKITDVEKRVFIFRARLQEDEHLKGSSQPTRAK